MDTNYTRTTEFNSTSEGLKATLTFDGPCERITIDTDTRCEKCGEAFHNTDAQGYLSWNTPQVWRGQLRHPVCAAARKYVNAYRTRKAQDSEGEWVTFGEPVASMPAPTHRGELKNEEELVQQVRELVLAADFTEDHDGIVIRVEDEPAQPWGPPEVLQ